MISRIITGTAGTPLTRAERTSLQSLRATYQSASHIFTERELAHMRFVRWLVHSPAWNQEMDRADEHATGFPSFREPHAFSQEMQPWMPGFLV